VDPHGRTLNGILSGFPENVTILSTTTTLMYANGTEAMVSNGVYNHHIGIADIMRPPVLIIKCPDGKPEPSIEVSLFAGVGEDRGRYIYSTTDDSIRGGFYLGKSPKILALMEVINYSSVEKQVYAVVDMEYVEGPIVGGMEVSPEILSVTQCSGTDQIVRPKQGQKVFSMKSKDLVVNLDGYAFLGRGHLHDGGLNQTLLINGKVVCDSLAIYGEAGGVLKQGGKTWATLTSMAECMSKPVKFSKGDVINLVSNYDLEKHPAYVTHVSGLEKSRTDNDTGELTPMDMVWPKKWDLLSSALLRRRND
jgi:hypothetical protein